jgi:hypothetical protein
LAAGVALTAATALAVGASSPAAADDEPADCNSHSYDDEDVGGSSGEVNKGDAGDPRYSVQFWAEGEHLSLWDFHPDGHEAEATAYITEPGGEMVDFDRFRTGSSDGAHYNLGTPDGSGNIPEGYKVWIRLRHTGGDWCYAVKFTA